MAAEGIQGPKKTRRDFLYLTTGAIGAVGAVMATRTLLNSMNPAADVLAQSTIDVDLKPIIAGQAITVMWRGKPLFIRHRTAQEIVEAKAGDAQTLRDYQKDATRAEKPEWLVVVGVCTHLGCVPLGQKPTDNRGDYKGWFCPCHGSHYDTSGRIRKGPAPTNLEIPPYQFINDTTIRIGVEV